MANKKVSDLPTVSSSADSDILYAIQSGVSVQETVKQVSDKIFGNISLTYAGDPNGNVAGTQKQYLYDSANDYIWFCKTTGTSSTAVWIPAFGDMTDGELIIGNSSGVPQKATLSAGAGILITNGSGTITLSTTTIAFPYIEVSGTSQAMAVNTGYIANNPGLVTFTFPAAAGIGDRVELIGKGAGGWKIAQSGSEQIHVGANSTTIGSGGSLASQNQFDSVTLVCTVANTVWTALNAPQGPLTVV